MQMPQGAGRGVPGKWSKAGETQQATADLAGEKSNFSFSLWASFEDQLKASDTSRKPAEIWLKNSQSVQTAQKKPNLCKGLAANS